MSYVKLVDSVKSSISLLICYLVLSIIESVLLKSVTIIIKLSISHLISVGFCFMYFGTLLLGLFL